MPQPQPQQPPIFIIEVRKVYRKKCYTVKKKNRRGKPKQLGKPVFAKCTTKAKAKRQYQYLQDIVRNNPKTRKTYGFPRAPIP